MAERLCALKLFQSAPLTDVRGDTCWHTIHYDDDTVSIRSPHGCKGRLSFDRAIRAPIRFQSAPLTDVRGDSATYRGAPRRPMVSIRSPHGCKGRSAVVKFGFLLVYVSIRSPHGCKGRSGWRRTGMASSMFQSAPLTDVRGDACDFPIPCGPTRFQSAPLTDVRGDVEEWEKLRDRARGFNPLPSRM